MTTGSAAPVGITDLQQSIFNAPVPGAATTTTALPSKPPTAADHSMTDAATPESRGTKRPRDEENEEEFDSDVAMEEESDEE